MLRTAIIPVALLLLTGMAFVWSGGGMRGRADFVFINRGDIITLDPNQMSYLQDIRMAYAMWEGLYTYHPETLQPIPGCSTEPDVSEDKRVYTFHIRPEAKWSNGDKVTSGDFVFAWRRMLESPGEYSYLLYYIKGAEQYVADFSKGKATDFATVGIEAPDHETLRVTLTDPVAFFLDLCAFPPFLPLHEPSMRPFAASNPDARAVEYDPRFTRPPHVVTNGPFMLVQWDFKQRLLLERNPHYWDRENVKSESIEMVVVEDSLTQLLRYETGSVDWLSAVPTEIAPDLKAAGREDLRSFQGFGTAYLSYNISPTFLNGRANPLADRRVRLALSMAIDKQTIIDTITRMGEKPASTFVPPNTFPGYRQQQGIEFDRARARELLAEAGYGGGGSLPGVTYLFRSDLPSSREMAQQLARQWKHALNIEVPLESVEMQTARQRVNDLNYSIVSANWIGDYGDPSTFTDKYRSNSANNNTGWASAEYDRLLFQATKEPDTEKRLRLIEQAEAILLHEAPIFPLYHVTNQYLFRDNVKGINLSPRNMTMFKAVYVQR